MHSPESGAAFSPFPPSKGAGGEAERNPAHLWRRGVGVRNWQLARARRGTDAPHAAIATIHATIAAALLALGQIDTPAAADAAAREIWLARV